MAAAVIQNLQCAQLGMWLLAGCRHFVLAQWLGCLGASIRCSAARFQGNRWQLARCQDADAKVQPKEKNPSFAGFSAPQAASLPVPTERRVECSGLKFRS